jgi:hypothetical protein
MVQAPAQSAPNPVATPQAPAPPALPGVDASGQYTLPRTRAELRALEQARSDLSDQLQSAAGRREELAQEMATIDRAARPGLQARIDQLDQRILRIEKDIEVTGDLLARSRLQLTDAGPGPDGPPWRNSDMNMTAVGVLFTLFVLGPIAISIARNIWRRGSRSKVESPVERDNAERLSRLEQSIDTIAVEVERISEGQRFVTKLLNDSANREKAMLERGHS